HQHTAVMTEVGCGNWSPEMKPVTLEVIKICIESTDVTVKLVKCFSILKCISFCQVLVDEHGDGLCVHAMIYQALPCNGGKLSVTGIKFPKTFDDPLIPL
uniref:Uncharacterized protein n=1 Tax=Cyprinus carpio TaxID=7962 RepID=A0A8C2KBC5_CYPCA